jgi:cell fate regulator YaaT (PSP1 superfamily)
MMEHAHDRGQRQYFVQFGRSAYVGAFDSHSEFQRNTSVVIQTARGRELGLIQCELKTHDSAIGSILQSRSDDDLKDQHQAENFASHILSRAQEKNRAPVLFVDAEAVLDGSLVLLHVVPQQECDLSHLLAELSAEFKTRVHLIDLSQAQTLPDATDAQDGNCGKANCGEGNCSTTGGCSTGSCSRGAVKSAGELTDYFKNLRGQMEADQARRVTLN